MPSEYVLEMNNITKEYGQNAVLKDVSLRVKPGEIHALLGENGAGKSTLMNILFGMPVIHATGLAYYILSGEDGKTIRTKPNLAYPYHPMIEYVNNLEGTYFSPDYYNQPIWTSFMLHSENYAFLTDPKAAKKKFPDWM